MYRGPKVKVAVEPLPRRPSSRRTIIATPPLWISVELFWVSFWEMRWSGGGLVEVIVVVTIA